MRIVDANLSHAEDLLTLPLRQLDVDEWVLGSGGKIVKRSVREALETPPVYPRALLNAEGRCTCLWGVSGLADDTRMGTAWLIATKEAEGVASRLHRQWKEEVALMHTYYPVLLAGVYRKNALHLKWLRVVGFTKFGNSPDPLFDVYMRHNDV